jgi:hypothetical protein
MEGADSPLYGDVIGKIAAGGLDKRGKRDIVEGKYTLCIIL